MFKYMIAYQATGNTQIDVYGPFSSHKEAWSWAKTKTWRFPENIQVVTLQLPD